MALDQRKEKLPARILIAKPGLDGHDRGAKLIARALRDAGFEVIYAGIRQWPEQIALMAAQEDVDVVGLSILSGAHLALTKKVLAALGGLGAGHIAVAVGGTIPSHDIRALLEAGARAVLATGTPLPDVVAAIADLTSDSGAVK